MHLSAEVDGLTLQLARSCSAARTARNSRTAHLPAASSLAGHRQTREAQTRDEDVVLGSSVPMPILRQCREARRLVATTPHHVGFAAESLECLAHLAGLEQDVPDGHDMPSSVPASRTLSTDVAKVDDGHRRVLVPRPDTEDQSN
jgi:hypothetical protein